MKAKNLNISLSGPLLLWWLWVLNDSVTLRTGERWTKRMRDRADRWWSLQRPQFDSAPAHLCPHAALLDVRGSVSEWFLCLENTWARFIWATRRHRGVEAAQCTNGPALNGQHSKGRRLWPAAFSAETQVTQPLCRVTSQLRVSAPTFTASSSWIIFHFHQGCTDPLFSLTIPISISHVLYRPLPIL